MAYVSKADKARIAPAMKLVAKKYGFKISVSVKHNSTIIAKIKNADVLIADSPYDAAQVYERGVDINQYHIKSSFNKYAVFLEELHAAMKGNDYYNNDDAMTDYFDRSHYTCITLLPNK